MVRYHHSEYYIEWWPPPHAPQFITLVCSPSVRRTSVLAEPSLRNMPIVSFSRHRSLIALAVLAVSLREWTKMSTWFLPAFCITLSYTISFINYTHTHTQVWLRVERSVGIKHKYFKEIATAEYLSASLVVQRCCLLAYKHPSAQPNKKTKQLNCILYSERELEERWKQARHSHEEHNTDPPIYTWHSSRLARASKTTAVEKLLMCY